MPENLIGYIGVSLTIIWFISILVWFFKRKYGRVRSVRATVVNKQVTESFSKYSGIGKIKQYYITFQIGNKRRSFKVSAFSYNGYRQGQTGTLKYKADRLIEFR